jgi:hypothetical protein
MLLSSRHVAKNAILRAQLDEVRIRPTRSSDAFLRFRLKHIEELIRVRIGKRFQEHCVNDAENSRVRANAECKREHSDGGEGGGLAQGAEAIAEVAEEIVEVSFPPGVADFFFDAFEAAEFHLGAATGFFGGHASCDIVDDLPFEMEAEFLVEELVHTSFPK